MTDLHQWIGTVILLVGFVISGVAAVLRVGYLLGTFKDEMKADYDAKILLLKSDSEGKVGRVYERFDEYKNFIETNFIRKDMCSVLHADNARIAQRTESRLDSIEAKLDELRTIVLKG